jgi:hypothetical protein
MEDVIGMNEYSAVDDSGGAVGMIFSSPTFDSTTLSLGLILPPLPSLSSSPFLDLASDREPVLDLALLPSLSPFSLFSSSIDMLGGRVSAAGTTGEAGRGSTVEKEEEETIVAVVVVREGTDDDDEADVDVMVMAGAMGMLVVKGAAERMGEEETLLESNKLPVPVVLPVVDRVEVVEAEDAPVCVMLPLLLLFFFFFAAPPVPVVATPTSFSSPAIPPLLSLCNGSTLLAFFIF